MKYSGLILFLSILLFSCKKEAAPIEEESIEKGLLTDQLIKINALDRTYHLFLPDDYSNAPVIFLFHGHSGNHDGLLGLGGASAPYKLWLDIAAQENLILAIPNGLNTADDEKGWNDCRADAPTNSTANDVLFINTLLDYILTNYQAASNKVYISGTSNGGHFCIRLANEMPEKITAFAAIVAANAVNSECTTANLPVSALFINGTNDPFLPYDGGQMAFNRGEVFSTANTVQYWVNRNGTALTPTVENLEDTNLNDNCTIEKSTYKNGSNNTEVVLYKIINGGHAEPSITENYSTPILAILGNQNRDIEMATEVWSFFKNKTK